MKMKTNAELIAKGDQIRKIEVLVQKFGGTRKGWGKYKSVDSAGREVHWYEHHGIGKKGVKFAGFPDGF
jgi:regulator of RNase E activity RraB